MIKLNSKIAGKTGKIQRFSAPLFLFIILYNIFFNPILVLATPSQQQLLNQQFILQQQQEQRRQQEQNQLQIDNTENIRKTSVGGVGIESIDGNDGVGFGAGGDSADGSSSDGPGSSNLNCIKFNKIELIGNNIYSTKYLNRKVLNKYINKCINKKNIDNMINSLMKIYIDNGYSTTRVYFDISKLRIDDTFIFVIDEGRVNNIILNNIYLEINKKDSKKENKKTKTSLFDKYKLFRLKSQTFFAFPFIRNKIFNLKDFEQGLNQLNRLQSNNATLDIKPIKISDQVTKSNSNSNSTMSLSSINSYSNIIINNKKSRSTYLDLSIDNSGNKSTGEKIASISISQENLLAFDDNIYLKYTQNIDTKNIKRYNKSFYSNISIPLGYWTFSQSLSYSKYLTTVNGHYTTFHISGNTLIQTYNIDRIMYRNQIYKLNLGSNITIKDTESYIRDLKSQTGSRKSSNISLYLNNIVYTKLGTIILKPSYQKGLKWFNSKKDENHNLMLKTEPRLQYDMVKLYAYYNTRINLPLFTKTQIVDINTNQLIMQEVEKEVKIKTIKKDKNNNIIKDKKGEPIKETKIKKIKEQIPYKVRNKIDLNYTLTFDSQYSWNTLYGADQFSIGGEYTVRGFREATIIGNSGYYIRNDLRVNLQQLFPKFILNSKPMEIGNISINDAITKTYISIFYDYGHVQNKYKILNDIYNSNSGHMAGMGIAINYHGKYLNWSLTYAKALHSPNYLQSRDNIKKEGHSLYWRVTGRF